MTSTVKQMSLRELLAAPFPDKDLNWRVGTTGFKSNGAPWAMILAYVDARAIMDRLDAVMGPDRWKDEYTHKDHGVECKLSLKIGEEWVTKVDGSPETAIEGFKGGYSKSLVRAAVKWGIGRGLYDMPVIYAKECPRGTKGATNSKVQDKYKKHKDAWITWVPPQLGGKW